jgi:hypothetical protein
MTRYYAPLNRTTTEIDKEECFLLLVQNGKSSVNSGSFQPGVYRVNPYDIYREEMEIDDVDIQIKYNWTYFEQTYHFTGSLAARAFYPSPGDISFPPWADHVEQLALQKAQAKLGQSDLDLGENLGEIRETIEMLKNPLKDLRRFLWSDRRRNLRLLKRLLSYRKTGRYAGKTGKAAAKAAASTWLELRYGFRPLIMLLGDLIEQAQDQMNQTFDPDKIRSVRAAVDGGNKKSLSSGTFGLGGTTLVYDKVTDDKVIGTASIQYRQSVPLTALQSLGLSPRHWPEIAWELTKLSHVWDWFITIGPWLGSIRVHPEITVLGNTTGKHLTRTVTCRVLEAKVYGDLYAGEPVSPPATGKRTLNRYLRSVNTEPPLTPLLRPPNVLDLLKSIDSVALIYQRIFR